MYSRGYVNVNKTIQKLGKIQAAMLRSSCKLIYTFKIKKNLWVQPQAKCSTMTKNNNKDNVMQFLKHEDKILEIINESNLNKLTKFISASYAEMLILNRTNNGPYKSLYDILLKTKIDVDILNNFYSLLINYNTWQKWNRCIKPSIKTSILPETLLSIHVGPTVISWTLINRDFMVLDWDCIIWKNKSSKSTKNCDIIDLIPSFVQQLPLCSTYVIEEFEVRKRPYYNLFVQHLVNICIASCIKVLINQRTDNLNSSADNLYVLKPLTTARFFKLMLGSEAVAVEYVMQVILDDNKKGIERLQNICIGYEFKKLYTENISDNREQMGWSLLKALTCLYIFKYSIP